MTELLKYSKDNSNRYDLRLLRSGSGDHRLLSIFNCTLRLSLPLFLFLAQNRIGVWYLYMDSLSIQKIMKPIKFFSWTKWKTGRYRAKIMLPGVVVDEILQRRNGECVVITTDRRCLLMPQKRIFLIEEPSVP